MAVPFDTNIPYSLAQSTAIDKLQARVSVLESEVADIRSQLADAIGAAQTLSVFAGMKDEWKWVPNHVWDQLASMVESLKAGGMEQFVSECESICYDIQGDVVYVPDQRAVAFSVGDLLKTTKAPPESVLAILYGKIKKTEDNLFDPFQDEAATNMQEAFYRKYIKE